MRVLIVTGTYPPDKCGVGDYTYCLANALVVRPGMEVGVLTSTGSEIAADASLVTVFRAMPNWLIRNLLQVKQTVSKFRPDIVHIQYPTQRYTGRLPKILPLFARLIGIPVAQTWHEHFNGCVHLGWQNLLACDTLIYVRPDLPQRFPAWVRRLLGKTPVVYVPSASTIPVASLNAEQVQDIKQKLSGGKPIVCFFGFAHQNKGVERLFEIADPAKHHLVLICDLNDHEPYQAKILRIANQAPWAGKVTVTGFQSERRVGEILAAADAVVFPFPGGAGVWNTSLTAAKAAGAFTMATTQDTKLLGYNAQENIYFADCDGIPAMREALSKYLGTRREPLVGNEWDRVAFAHEQKYRKICGGK
jgi:glycosyltransferase involved in cell wall biosynthesis